MLDLVIRGGRVITPQGVGSWDVGVQDGRIAVLGAPGTLPSDAARVMDASGLIVSPGRPLLLETPDLSVAAVVTMLGGRLHPLPGVAL